MIPAPSAAPESDPLTGETDLELDVSIILPVYNEAEHLVQEVERVRAAMDASPYSYEIIVVDDGSSDKSAEVAAGIEGIRFLQFLQNRGSGSARKAGTKAARGRITVWTDVDMTYPNDTIPQLVAELDGYDQVVGARRSEEGTHKALRVPAKWLIRKLAEFLTSTKIPDLNSGFRAFRTDVARQYLGQLPPGFSCVTTITMTFLANGYSVKYLPIDYAKRAGESKFHWYKDTRRYATQVVRMILSYNPLRIFMPIGLVLTAIGFVKLIVDIVGMNWHVAADTLLVLFAAFQVIAIGLLADLMTRATRARSELPPATAAMRVAQTRTATPASVRS
jgi:glycosyltransferase involved in cell wall biosynthesis